MTDRYGPNSAEVEALIAKIRKVTPNQAENLALAWDTSRSVDEAWLAAWKASRVVRRDIDVAVVDAWDAALGVITGDAWGVARDAIVAVTARDLISQEDFNTLYSPWKSMMEAEDDRDINSLSTTA